MLTEKFKKSEVSLDSIDLSISKVNANLTPARESKIEMKKNKSINKRDSIANSLNISNVIIGAGILNLPYFYRESGLFLGILEMFLVFLLACHTFLLYSYVSFQVNNKKRGTSSSAFPSLKKLWNHYYPSLWFLMDLVIILNCFIASLSYLVVISNSINLEFLERLFSPWEAKIQKIAKRLLILIPCICVQLCISQMESFSSLNYISFLGMLSNFYLLFLNLKTFFKASLSATPPLTSKSGFLVRAIKNLPFLTVSFNGHFASTTLLTDFFQANKDKVPKLKTSTGGKTNAKKKSKSSESKVSSEKSKKPRLHTDKQKSPHHTKKVLDKNRSQNGKEGLGRDFKRKSNTFFGVGDKGSQNLTWSKFVFSSRIGFFIVFLINTAVGISGLYAFNESVNENISNNYGNDIWAIFLKLSVSVSVFCSFPFAFRVCRTTLQEVLFGLGISNFLMDIGLLFILLCISIFVENLKNVNDLRGIFTGNLIVFIFPGLLFRKFLLKNKILSNRKKIMCMLYIIYGISCSTIGIVFFVKNRV